MVRGKPEVEDQIGDRRESSSRHAQQVLLQLVYVC
jgi:hypothetical protein